jgi:cobalamin biosynthesis Mg chelatase CobN
MRQRKSRPHIFTFAVATALVAIASIAPAAAIADSGGDEYTLNVPGGGNTPINGHAGAGGGSSSTSSDVSPATATDTTEAPATGSTVPTDTESTSGGGQGTNHHANNGDKNASQGKAGGEKPRQGLVSPNNANAPTVGASSSDDGGVPFFLIVIAVLGAGCVGLAVWRMRRGGGGTGGGESRSTTEPGTQSL